MRTLAPFPLAITQRAVSLLYLTLSDFIIDGAGTAPGETTPRAVQCHVGHRAVRQGTAGSPTLLIVLSA